MHTVKLTMVVLLAALPLWVAAQAGPLAADAPEVFNGTAQAKNDGGAVSATLDVTVRRYTPEFDRAAIESALRLGGYPRFLTALREAPEVGQLVLGGTQPYAIRYARNRVEAGGRTIVVVTDRPIFFVGAGLAKAKPKAGYEVAVLEIKLDATGEGSGTLAAAARVRPDGDGGVLLEDYAEAPIEVMKVTRKPS